MHSYSIAIYTLGPPLMMSDLLSVLPSLGLLSKTEEIKMPSSLGGSECLSENTKHLACGKFSKMLAIIIFKWPFAYSERNVGPIGLITEQKNTLLSGEKNPTSARTLLRVYNDPSHTGRHHICSVHGKSITFYFSAGPCPSAVSYYRVHFELGSPSFPQVTLVW